MAQQDVVSNNLATFTRPSINGMINGAKSNKITLDKFSNYYLLEDSIRLGFPLLKKYDNIIRSSIQPYQIAKDRYYRPEYVSYDLYGTTDLWYLLLYVNDIYRVEDFVGPTIKIPSYNPLQVLNAILADEGNLQHAPDNPYRISKSYLKHPSLPSDTLTRTIREKHIPWARGSKIYDLPKFPWSSTFYRSEFYVEAGTLKDANGNPVKAIKLDNLGTTSIPSLYFKTGYKKKLTGRVYLETGFHYALLKDLNGSAVFRLSKDGHDIIYEKFDHDFGEAFLIGDSRSANIESTTGSPVLTSSVVNFDDQHGVYKFRSLVSSMQQALLQDGAYLAKTTFTESKRDRLDVKRLNGSDRIRANVIYSFNLGNIDFLESLEHQLIVTYTDGSTQVSEPSTPRLDIVDTQGHRAVIKVTVPNFPTKKITKVEVKTLCKFKKTPPTSFNLEYNLYGVHLFQGLNSKSLTTPVTPPKTGWYDLTLEYNYKISDENGYDLFPDDLYHGIYFNPKFVRVSSDHTVDISYIPRINDGGNTTLPVTTELKPPRLVITSPNTSRDVRIFTGSLKFPDEFMLTLKLTHSSLNQGGGVGFVFNYDKDKEQGYLLWISSTGTNQRLTDFAKDGGQNILRTGFYELDSIEGTPYPIFIGDSLMTLSVSNYHPLEINGRYLKIIRHLNRIRIFPSDENGNLTSTTGALLDLQDVSNYHAGGGWMAMAVYATATLDLVKFEKWNDLGLVDNSKPDW